MALRFRRSVQIIPGVRLNFSGSGIGVSMGVPGARVTVGPSGVYRHLSLPGTGLYSRQRIDVGIGGQRGRGRGPAPLPPFELDLDEEALELRLIDPETREVLPPAQARRVRAALGSRADDILEAAVKGYDEEVDALLRIHETTPPPHPPALFVALPFPEPQPFPPEAAPPGILDRLIPSRRRQAEAERSAAEATYAEALARWRGAREAHGEEMEALRIAFQERDEDPDAGARVLAEGLQSIEWPVPTLVDWDLHGQTLYLDVQLPGIEGFPDRRYRKLQRGLRLGVEVLSATRVRRKYATYVHGVLFRVVGEVFHRLPAVREVVASGFLRSPDPATGEDQDAFLLSVQVERAQWERLRFDRLSDLDPVAVLGTWPHRRQMTATAIFTPIEPFSGPTAKGTKGSTRESRPEESS